jgi:prophage regulatory protein
MRAYSDGKGAALVFAPSAEVMNLHLTDHKRDHAKPAPPSVGFVLRQLFLALVTQGPHVSRDRLEIFVRKLHTAHRRHGTWVLLWLDHAIFNCFGKPWLYLLVPHDAGRLMPHSLPETGFVRLANLLSPAGPIPVSKSTWWSGVKTGRFPKPIKLGPRITVWRVEDIRALIREGAL